MPALEAGPLSPVLEVALVPIPANVVTIFEADTTRILSPNNSFVYTSPVVVILMPMGVSNKALEAGPLSPPYPEEDPQTPRKTSTIKVESNLRIQLPVPSTMYVTDAVSIHTDVGRFKVQEEAGPPVPVLVAGPVPATNATVCNELLSFVGLEVGEVPSTVSTTQEITSRKFTIQHNILMLQSGSPLDTNNIGILDVQ